MKDAAAASEAGAGTQEGGAAGTAAQNLATTQAGAQIADANKKELKMRKKQVDNKLNRDLMHDRGMSTYDAIAYMANPKKPKGRGEE